MGDERRLARRVGGACLVLALVAAVATMLLSGITLSPGFVLHVEFERIANLREGSKVMMCGQDVGEVVAVRLAPRRSFLQPRTGDPDTPEEPRLVLDLWLRLRFRRHIRRNSEIFVNQVGVLGEQYLEIGAPRGAPGPVVAWGDHLRGIDPPRIDRLLAQAYRNLRVVTTALREAGPFARELANAFEHLVEIRQEAGLGGPALDDLYGRVAAMLHQGQALWQTLRTATHGGADLRALRRELAPLGPRLAAEIRGIVNRVDSLRRRLERGREIWSPRRRQRTVRALATLGRVLTVAEQIVRDVDAVLAMVARGDGTVGALLQDRELWDEFHQVHKILKQKPWSTVIRPGRPVRE